MTKRSNRAVWRKRHFGPRGYDLHVGDDLVATVKPSDDGWFLVFAHGPGVIALDHIARSSARAETHTPRC